MATTSLLRMGLPQPSSKPPIWSLHAHTCSISFVALNLSAVAFVRFSARRVRNGADTVVRMTGTCTQVDRTIACRQQIERLQNTREARQRAAGSAVHRDGLVDIRRTTRCSDYRGKSQYGYHGQSFSVHLP